MAPEANSLSIPLNNKEGGWLVCPKCRAESEKPTDYCLKCHYQRPDSWGHKEKPRSRWIIPLIIFCTLIIILSYLIWNSRAYIYVPKPKFLFRKPVSTISALSAPNDWAGYAHDPTHTRYLQEATPLKGRIRWSLDLGRVTNSAPTVKGGILYLGGYNKIHALEAGTGKTVWEISTTGPVHSSFAVTEKLIFVGLLDRRVMALNRFTAEPQWEFRTGSWVFGSPTVVNGILYVGSGDRAIYAIDAQNGQLIWRTQTEGLTLSAPAIKDGILYAMSNDRKLYCLDAGTGAMRLRYRISLNSFESPVIANDLVYVVASNGKLYTIRHGIREYPGQYTLYRLWRQLWLWRFPVSLPRQTGSNWVSSPKYFRKGFRSSPAATPDSLYIGDRLGFFYARDALKGDGLWEFKARSAILAAPLVLGDEVYFGTENGELYALDRHKGEFLWKVTLDAPIKIAPVYAAGLLFVRTEDGKLSAIE